jgi:hypothetical protein
MVKKVEAEVEQEIDRQEEEEERRETNKGTNNRKRRRKIEKNSVRKEKGGIKSEKKIRGEQQDRNIEK